MFQITYTLHLRPLCHVEKATLLTIISPCFASISSGVKLYAMPPMLSVLPVHIEFLKLLETGQDKK